MVAALVLTLTDCGGRRIVVSPDPNHVAVGVGLKASFEASALDCGGFGDCARVRGSSVRFEEPDGSLLATDRLLFQPPAAGSTRLRLRFEELDEEVVISAVPVGRSEVFLEGRPGEAQVRAFRKSTVRVEQRHQDRNGESLLGWTDWLDGGVLAGCSGDNCVRRDLVVPDAGLLISTALASAPPRNEAALRVLAVDEAAITQLDISPPSGPSAAWRLVPLADDSRPICGSGPAQQPKLTSSAGLQVLVAPLLCGVSLTVRRTAAGAQHLEIRWGSQSRDLEFP